MKVKQKTEVSKGKVTFTLEMTDFTEEDAKQLLKRSELSIDSEIGATLIAKNFMGAFEAFSQFVARASGRDASDILKQHRKSYKEWAIAAMTGLIPDDK